MSTSDIVQRWIWIDCAELRRKWLVPMTSALCLCACVHACTLTLFYHVQTSGDCKLVCRRRHLGWRRIISLPFLPVPRNPYTRSFPQHIARIASLLCFLLCGFETKRNDPWGVEQWSQPVGRMWFASDLYAKQTKTNSMVWVRERTIPTERPPLVGEAIANFCG
jgi:hypothetical protein